MFTLTLVLLLAGVCWGKSEDPPPDTTNYNKALSIIEKNYEHRRSEYNAMYKTPLFHWEFSEYDSFPFGCSDFKFEEDSNTVDWVWMYGPIIGQVKGDPDKIQVGVVSYLKKSDPPDSRVYRMFFLQKNSKGAWFQYHNPVTIKESWNGEMYVCQ